MSVSAPLDELWALAAGVAVVVVVGVPTDDAAARRADVRVARAMAREREKKLLMVWSKSLLAPLSL